jgi:CheY-like chemotaxis protein
VEQELSSSTILVVDDDRELREAVADLLVDEGNTVVQATNGLEALVYLRSHRPPSLVLLDLAMPVMDGWQCLRELRADPALAGIPVVVVSGEGRETAPVPADRFLKKPFNVPELFAMVHRHLARVGPGMQLAG